MRTLALFLVVLFAGCVHRAEVFKAPDSTAMIEHGRKMAAAVASARTHVQSAGEALAGSEKSQTAARALFDIVLPKIDRLPLDTPAEMKLSVASIQEDMSSLRELLNDSIGDTSTARAELTAAGQKLEEATSEKNLTQVATDAYIAAATKEAKSHTDDSAKWHEDSVALARYRLHFWLSWIIAGAGALLCLLIAVLKLTGRLAVTAARVGI